MIEQRTAAYYDRHAEEYDEVMARDPRNAVVRRAFHALVASVVPAGARVLDFGCGTGIDAAWYAGRGHAVIAYDHAARMVERITTNYPSPVAAGSIIPTSFPFASFPDALPPAARGPVDAVMANFAVLNLISDLPGLFDQFALLVRPGGVVIASVLNPYYWRDLRIATQVLRRRGTLVIDGGDSASYRYRVSAVTRAARQFVLVTREGWVRQFVVLVFRRRG
jgi:SAM-dependent methyltransferase